MPFFPTLLPLLLLLLLQSPTLTLTSSPPSPDFLIIGGGTAGCTLAARLCALLPNRTVLLLERAPPRNATADLLVRSPRNMWASWLPSSPVAESFTSLPNPALNNRSIPLYTGHTLGGSSAINGMQWVVPLAPSVDQWHIHGLHTSNSKLYYNRAFHQVGFAPQAGSLRHRYAAPYVRAAARAGYPNNRDPFDDAQPRNMYQNRLAVDRNGFRVDACTAYVDPIRDSVCKANLRLMQGVTVTKVLLEASAGRKRAIGVEYVRSDGAKRGPARRVYARREVIVSAGPFGSPKLLQLSGIGPREVLERVGIRVEVELGVGRRTLARNFVVVLSRYEGVPLERSNNGTVLDDVEELERWKKGRRGVYGIGSFFGNGRDGLDAYMTCVGSYFPSMVDERFLSTSCNGNVESFGRLELRDADPFSAPRVQLGLLRRDGDLRRIARCVRRMVKVHGQFPRRWKARVVDPPEGVVTEKWMRSTAG